MNQEKIDFLRRLTIFSYLTDEQLADVAQITDAYSFKRGAIIAYQHDVADKMYIIKSGRIESYEVQDGIVSRSQLFSDGDYFEESWLMHTGTHWGTVRAATDGILYAISYEEFLLFIDDHPEVVLDLSEETWSEVDRSKATHHTKTYNKLNLLADELIEYESRRTGILLFVQLILPVLLLFTLPALVWIGTHTVLTTPPFWLMAIAMGLVALPPLLYSFYKYFDWANDYLLITNKHLVHREFDLGSFTGDILKIPLDQIQSVRVLKPSLIESLLQLGTVQVTTAAQRQGLIFDYISRPGDAEQTINRIRQIERNLDASRERRDVRRTIEEHFAVQAQLEEAEIPDETDATAVAQKKQQQSRRKKRLKRRGDRVQEGNTITYGRHWIVFARGAWWLVLLMLATLVIIPLAITNFPLLIRPIMLVSFVVVLAELIGLYFFYEDWTNDLFQLTGDMVIDIDRGPFGFTESRKTAQLVNVQNVRAEQKSLIATLFGFGDVVVDTAGASNDIVFENVKNPNQVQTDIFQKREQILTNKRKKDAVARRKEFTTMLDEYQHLREQGKIPRRTPRQSTSLGEDGVLRSHVRDQRNDEDII